MSDEFNEILQDVSKTIEGDIVWQNHPRHELLLKFKAEIASELGNYQLSMRGTYNPLIGGLSYHIICPPYGRILCNSRQCCNWSYSYDLYTLMTIFKV